MKEFQKLLDELVAVSQRCAQKWSQDSDNKIDDVQKKILDAVKLLENPWISVDELPLHQVGQANCAIDYSPQYITITKDGLYQLSYYDFVLEKWKSSGYFSETIFPTHYMTPPERK